MARTHAQLVAEGKRLVAAEGDAKWQLGDLALEVTEHGTGELKEFADEIGIDPGTLAQYRRIAAEWPDRRARRSAAWSVYAALAPYQDAEKILDRLVRAGKATVDEARKAVGARPTNNPSAPSSTTEKTAAAKALLADPAVQRAIVADGPLRVELNQAARVHHEQTAANATRKLRESGKGGAQLAEIAEFLDVMKAMLKMRTEGAVALDRLSAMPKLTDSQRSQVQREVNWIRENLDLIDGFTSGRRAATIADEVEQFLEREAAR
jgi:hypothetical protein